MLWHHGHYVFNDNGSITLQPLTDGYQQVQDPCAAETNFIQQYDTQELYTHWNIFTDTDGPKMYLYDSGGAPLAPLFQVYSTANILPEELLRNSTTTVSDSTLIALNSGVHHWGPADTISLLSGVFALGVASLLV